MFSAFCNYGRDEFMSFQVPQKMSTAGKLGDENINVFEVCEAACEKIQYFHFCIGSESLYFERLVPSQQKGF